MSDPFDPAALARAVHDTLDQATAAIPEGKRGALLVDGRISDGKPSASLLLVTRGPHGWDLAGEMGWDGHYVNAKVAVAKTW